MGALCALTTNSCNSDSVDVNVAKPHVQTRSISSLLLYEEFAPDDFKSIVNVWVNEKKFLERKKNMDFPSPKENNSCKDFVICIWMEN